MIQDVNYPKDLWIWKLQRGCVGALHNLNVRRLSKHVCDCNVSSGKARYCIVKNAALLRPLQTFFLNDTRFPSLCFATRQSFGPLFSRLRGVDVLCCGSDCGAPVMINRQKWSYMYSRTREWWFQPSRVIFSRWVWILKIKPGMLSTGEQTGYIDKKDILIKEHHPLINPGFFYALWVAPTAAGLAQVIVMLAHHSGLAANRVSSPVIVLFFQMALIRSLIIPLFKCRLVVVPKFLANKRMCFAHGTKLRYKMYSEEKKH